MYRSIFIVCLVVVTLIIRPGNAQGTQIIPGADCTQNDVVLMMGKCMLKFTRGHGATVVAKMKKTLYCDMSLINCGVVLETRLCLADLSSKELTQPCKPFVDRVADYQFGVFNIPCRVSHLKEACRGYFLERGHLNF